MKIVNLTYWPIPNLPGHEILHRSIKDIIYVGWDKSIEEIDRFNPDMILEREGNDGIALFEPIYRAFPAVKKAWYWIDSHVNFNERIEYAKLFDYLFVAVSQNIARIRKAVKHDRVHWMPLCWPAPKELIIPNTEPKKFDVTFVGRWKPEWYFKDRFACINHLQKVYGDRFLAVTDYENMTSIIRKSRVSINYPVREDLNFRVFEVLGCGTELVTKFTFDTQMLRVLDHSSFFCSFDEMVKEINNILDGKVKHDLVAAQNWLKNGHSIEHRYSAMIDKVMYDKEAVFTD